MLLLYIVKMGRDLKGARGFFCGLVNNRSTGKTLNDRRGPRGMMTLIEDFP